LSGGVIFPAILFQLEPTLGFAWATRIISFIILGTLVLAVLLLKRRIIPKERRRFFDPSAIRDGPYMMFNAGLVFGFMGSYIPFYYISAYATGVTHASSKLALYFVPIMNAASVFGRILPNMLADHIGTINTMAPCAVICAVLVFGWIGIHTLGGLIAFAILYGFFVGSYVSLANNGVLNLTSDLKVFGTRLGMSFTVTGFGVLIGNPIAGALINLETNSYIRMQIFSAVILFASGILFSAARVWKVGPGLSAWL
jgi:predicted MFS family arabinose efflux permease